MESFAERVLQFGNNLNDDDALRPIAEDVRALIRDLEAEHRLRDEEQLAWSPQSLRDLLQNELRGQDVIVVSNREPYIHVHDSVRRQTVFRAPNSIVRTLVRAAGIKAAVRLSA